jgi:hypothetical protein
MRISDAATYAVKPDTVQHAQYALAAWTAWTCLFGIYQMWTPNGAAQEFVDQLQAIVSVTPESVHSIAIGAYALIAASMVGVILQIGHGKTWPRTLLMVGFVLEAFWVAGQGEASALGYLADVPDFGLQGYALYLLYTRPGRDWFRRKTT